MPSSCLLYQNSLSTVILLDIPRSIEEAQGDSSLRLISSKPLERPYPSIEPKSEKARNNVGETSLDDMLLQKYLEFALDEVRRELKGNKSWLLPRITEEEVDVLSFQRKKKYPRQDASPNRNASLSLSEKEKESDHEALHLDDSLSNTIHYHNRLSAFLHITLGPSKGRARIPPKSTLLQGDIASTLDTFTTTAPLFDLVVLDPPWPNRSARRKKSYGISYGTTEIKDLLSALPIEAHLTENGLVAVWVTNKVAFRDLLLGEGGLFEQWGVQLVEEWVWLKVTSDGEPICALDSTWRKPYEILLIGRKPGKEREAEKGGEVKRRVILAVPDLHSRKPNLKSIFEQVMGRVEGDYEALEVFARNLTAGWWCWGNEVLKFQMSEHWKEVEH
jgi:N6-adenosine-specific RNA methylase IME4